MNRVLLQGLAAAAVLCASSGHPAAREPILPKKPKEIVVVGSGANKPQPKTLAGQQRRRGPTASGRKRGGTTSTYTNDFSCIPSSCQTGGSSGAAGISKQFQLLPPW